MSSEKNQNDSLNEHVDDISCIQDALSLLEIIFGDNIEEIQELLKDKVKLMDKEMMRHAYYNTMSLEAIMPKDIIQTILTFSASKHNSLVSKLFRKCVEINQEIVEKKRLSAINQAEFEPNIECDFFETKQSWIIRRDEPLNDEEINEGYRHSNSFEDAFDICGPGDELVICEKIIAAQVYERIRGHMQIRKNIILRGGCPDAYLAFVSYMIPEGISVYIKGLYIAGTIKVRGTLWLEDCGVVGKIDLNMWGKIYAKNCSFAPFNNEEKPVDKNEYIFWRISCYWL